MHALIVSESCFGNTAQIAEAIAEGLRSREVSVTVADATAATDLDGVDLLIVGSPTHNMGLPRPATRQQAKDKGGHPQASGIAEWLDALPRRQNRRAAAFATVTGGGFLSGSAAKGIEKRLRRLAVEVASREDFRVLGVEGPLADGELDRARQWGASLV